MGKADYYAEGSWNALCYQCGFKFKSFQLRKHWQGYYVCERCWEPRHPQDFVRARPDVQAPLWTQSAPTDILALGCTPEGSSAVPGLAVPGCAVPGYLSPLYLSSFSIGETPDFSTPPITGDHPPGDGLTRLQTAFAGGSSADLSTYAIGSGGNNGGTVGDGYFEIVQNSATFKALAWENAALATLDGPHCVEFFFEAFETSSNPPSTCNIEQHNVTQMSIPTMRILGHAGGINNVGWIASPVDEGFAPFSASPAVDVFGSVHHVVYQHDGENDALSIWYDGVRQLDSYGGWSGIGVATPYVYLGATGIGGQTITIRYYGVRVRRAEMYSGASFTPPSGPAAWGSP